MSNAASATDSAASGFFFMSEKARKNLPKFQYKGQDKSPLYNHVLSPLAAFLVDNCTPSNLAPNSITLFGLCFMIASYGIMWYYAPLIETASAHDDADAAAAADGDTSAETIPRWVFLYHGCALLIYQTLDNMDGKQARKTGSSSPLGLLFDHGCDAVNVIFGTVGWILGLGLSLQNTNDAILCVALVLGPFAMFYIPTWEEYYTGEMVLPYINGPTEGVFGGALLSFTTFAYGTQFWQSTSWVDALGLNLPLRNADIQVTLALLGMLQDCALRVWFVCHTKKFGWTKPLLNQIPYWFLFAIAVTNGPTWARMPRTSLHLASGLFVESVTQLMFDHITDEHFEYRHRFVLLPLLALPFLGVQPNERTDMLLLVYATAVWTYLIVKIRLIVHEICITLNLKCFDISKTKAE